MTETTGQPKDRSDQAGTSSIEKLRQYVLNIAADEGGTTSDVERSGRVEIDPDTFLFAQVIDPYEMFDVRPAESIEGERILALFVFDSFGRPIESIEVDDTHGDARFTTTVGEEDFDLNGDPILADAVRLSFFLRYHVEQAADDARNGRVPKRVAPVPLGDIVKLD